MKTLKRQIKVGDTVSLKWDIFRIESDKPYGEKGLKGIVTEIFKTSMSGDGSYCLFAKVKTDVGIKTFRLTSLEKEE